MSSTPFRLESLTTTHDRTPFNSGSEPLDSYFRSQVTQDIRRRITACFVTLTLRDETRIAGYAIFASISLLLSDIPPKLGKKLPRYPTVPAVRMGRLTVDHNFKKQGLGDVLLADALNRTINSKITAYALVADAKDKIVMSFYQHHGFIALSASSLTLFLPFENQ